MFVNSDFSDLLNLFKDNNVKYLVIGGYAVVQYSEEGYFYQMGIPPVRVDILMGIPSVQFDEAWERRVEIQFEDTSVTMISKQDLILAKRADGRPQDLLDADSLENAPD